MALAKASKVYSLRFSAAAVDFHCAELCGLCCVTSKMAACSTIKELISPTPVLLLLLLLEKRQNETGKVYI